MRVHEIKKKIYIYIVCIYIQSVKKNFFNFIENVKFISSFNIVVFISVF